MKVHKRDLYISLRKQKMVCTWLGYVAIALLSLSVVDLTYLEKGLSVLFTVVAMILMVLMLGSGRFVKFSVDKYIESLKEEINRDAEDLQRNAELIKRKRECENKNI